MGGGVDGDFSEATLVRRRRNSPDFRTLPKAAKKWVDGSGAAHLLRDQRALYVNLENDPPTGPIIWRERQMQASIIDYIDKKYPGIGSLCFHVPLELLRREKHTAGIFHALGARAGVADIILLVPAGAYHGLVLELKVPPRRPSDSQCHFLRSARTAGYAACWCDSINTVMQLIDAYLTLPPRARLAELTPTILEITHELGNRSEVAAEAH